MIRIKHLSNMVRYLEQTWSSNKDRVYGKLEDQYILVYNRNDGKYYEVDCMGFHKGSLLLSIENEYMNVEGSPKDYLETTSHFTNVANPRMVEKGAPGGCRLTEEHFFPPGKPKPPEPRDIKDNSGWEILVAFLAIVGTIGFLYFFSMVG